MHNADKQTPNRSIHKLDLDELKGVTGGVDFKVFSADMICMFHQFENNGYEEKNDIPLLGTKA